MRSLFLSDASNVKYFVLMREVHYKGARNVGEPCVADIVIAKLDGSQS